jgi:ribosomal-protein-alanine N-acetyltransferase
MRREDIDQVTDIDREAFPNMWPPANYKRELEISLAHYIVACDKEPAGKQAIERSEERLPGLSSRITLFRRRKSKRAACRGNESKSILGFGGLWIMADEAHITNVAVRREYRGRGIGEHLLIAMIGLAMDRNARTLTLEVRLSNEIAQRLYHKYGFTQVDIRRNYYTDNREDALVMAADDISGNQYQSLFRNLGEVYNRKWGDNHSNLSPT